MRASALLSLLIFSVTHAFDSQRFAIKDDAFTLDGSEIQIYSGSLHYWRVPRAYWQTRLQSVKALGEPSCSLLCCSWFKPHSVPCTAGLNTVQTCARLVSKKRSAAAAAAAATAVLQTRTGACTSRCQTPTPSRATWTWPPSCSWLQTRASFT